MNIQKFKKHTKWLRLHKELEEDLQEMDGYNPEVAADLRWSLISLARAIAGLGYKPRTEV